MGNNILDNPSAVLIRALAPPSSRHSLIVANGRIRKVKLNGEFVTLASGLWIADFAKDSSSRGKTKIKQTPRIGIGYTEEWIHKLLRFTVDVRNPCVVGVRKE